MKTKIIELIKDYRAESEKQGSPVYGYKNELTHKESLQCDQIADDLERLLADIKGDDEPANRH